MAKPEKDKIAAAAAAARHAAFVEAVQFVWWRAFEALDSGELETYDAVKSIAIKMNKEYVDGKR